MPLQVIQRNDSPGGDQSWRGLIVRREVESAADAFAPEILARLRAVRQDRDPANVFRSNFPVNP